MTIDIKVPVLPESVADALVLDWTRKIGETVSRDEVLVEVETDKVVLEVPAPEQGTLVEILEESGTTVAAEQVLGRIEPGAMTEGVGDVSSSEDTATVDVPHEAVDAAPDEGVRFSPAVRRLLEENGINPADIQGTGRGGRLTKEDVIGHIRRFAGSAATPVPASGPEPEPEPESARVTERDPETVKPAPGIREEIREPMSRLRQTIAHRLVQSQQGAALLTTFNEVNMHALMALRTRYKIQFEEAHGARLGFMSFFVKASVTALERYPLVNAYVDGTDIVRHMYQDIGIAVASPRGLVVPVLRNCESLALADIEQMVRDFGERARNGKIGMEELAGGTFTITNGGVFGSLLSTPIVNPPQSAILGMHRIQERPVAENGEVVVRPMMYLALSYDHRIIDGKEAVQFLVTVRDMIEDPARLLLDC